MLTKIVLGCWFSLLWFSMFWFPMLSWSKITRFTVPPSYELPASHQAPSSRVSIFGRLRRLWVVEFRGILKSRSVVFDLCPWRCVVDAYFFNVELPRSVWAVIAVLDYRRTVVQWVVKSLFRQASIPHLQHEAPMLSPPTTRLKLDEINWFFVLWIAEDSILCLPAMRFPACSHSSWHAHDEVFDQWTRYTPPAFFQSLTKALPLLFSHTVVVVLWIEFVHALLEMPPKVLNRVEVWWIRWPLDRCNMLRSKPCLGCTWCVYTRVVLHEKLGTSPMREETLLKSLNITLSAIATFWRIEILLYDDEFTPP